MIFTKEQELKLLNLIEEEYNRKKYTLSCYVPSCFDSIAQTEFVAASRVTLKKDMDLLQEIKEKLIKKSDVSN